MQDMKIDEIENLNPLTDTGKVLKQLLLDRLEERRRAEEERAQMAELQTQVKRVADAWDAEHKERETWKAAIKRGVLQILGAVGWVQK